jgi:hypothetical protein
MNLEIDIRRSKTGLLMQKISLIVLLLGFAAQGFATANPGTDQAKELALKSAEAQGGEAKLRAIKSAQISRISSTNHREQSERPEGPWVFTVKSNTQERNFEHRTEKTLNSSTRGYATANWWDNPEASVSPAVTVVTEEMAAASFKGKFRPGGAAVVQDVAESLALGPEKILITALEAPDLHSEPDVKMNGYMHKVIAFSFKRNPVRIFLNPPSMLIKAVEITRVRRYDSFWSPWGDVTTRTTFGMWILEPNGVRYPRLWQVESDGQQDTTTMITQVRFDVPWEADDFNVPEDVKKQFQQNSKTMDEYPFGSPAKPIHELAPGVVKVPSAWDIIEVKQDDGIVIFEGPLSSGYSARVIEDAQKRFPGTPIKAVITTSDSWPHLGGMREYVARGVPVYALDLNKPILDRLFKAPYKSFPDALAKSPRQPKWNLVSGKTLLGRGANRLQIYPYRSATGERQMMVYFPEHRLLYTSDLFSFRSDGSAFLPQFVQEMIDTVKREGLEVKNTVGMHYDMTPWQKVVDSAKPTQPEKPTK